MDASFMTIRNLSILMWLALLMLMGCAEKSPKQQREDTARAATAADPIRIGFVWPFSAEYDLLPEGVEMAVQELNADRVECDDNQTNCRTVSGLLGGRHIELIQRDDLDLVREGRLIAEEFAEDPDVTAVIGHAWSYISVPAAPLYEFNGLIMLSPSATSPDLTRNGFQYIFRNVLSDNEVGRQLANYAHEKGYLRMVILYADGSYGRQLSNVFENEAQKIGINILDRRTYRSSRNFQFILDQWAELDFDAIFIAGSNPDAAEFIRDARRKGIDDPVIGSDGLDTVDLWNIARESSIGTVVASFYHPDNPDSELQEFIIKFQEKYQTMPDTWAAQGYDAMMLLAYAIEEAGSTVPSEVTATLHATQNWEGVTGVHSFNANGDVVGKPLVLKIQEADGFKFLQLATDPPAD
jgi:branched-chain amino acid transport system substrate-binding protein